MSEVLFKIKFPEEYYEYDYVENLSGFDSSLFRKFQ